MNKQEIDNSGCLGLALMGIGGFGCFMGLVTGTGEFWYVGPLIPIGYLIYSE